MLSPPVDELFTLLSEVKEVTVVDFLTIPVVAFPVASLWAKQNCIPVFPAFNAEKADGKDEISEFVPL